MSSLPKNNTSMSQHAYLTCTSHFLFLTKDTPSVHIKTSMSLLPTK